MGRLDLLAELIAPADVIADIGSDHAKLPVMLVKMQKCKKCIAVEIASGPYNSAKNNIERSNLAEKIEIRLGDGLKPLFANECDAFVIAGMGGRTIIEIIHNSNDVVNDESIFYLQPMQEAPELRKWLDMNGFAIINEEIAHENSKLFEIIITKKIKGQKSIMSEMDCLLGAVLINKKHPLLNEKISLLIKQFTNIKEELTKNKISTIEIENKLKQLELVAREIEASNHNTGN